MLTLLFALFATDVRVTLPAEARASGTELVLEAIAAVECDDPATLARAKALRLGYAPAPGHSRLFPAQRLSSELASLAPDLSFIVVGAPSCRVFPKTQLVDSGALEAAAKAELERQLRGLDARLELAEPTQAVEVPIGQSAPVFDAQIQSAALRSGLVTVPVRIVIDDRLYRTVWTTWKLELWEWRPVLTQALRHGELIGSEMLETRRVQALGGLDSKRLDVRMLHGAIAAHDLTAGQAVGEADVIRLPIVEMNDLVFLSVKKGSIQARIACTSMQTGAIGDRIRVQINDSKRELTAVVSARDTVEIDLGR